MDTIKAYDIKPSTEQVVKIGGRWYWVTAVNKDDNLEHGFFVTTVPQAKDPRYGQIGYGHTRYVFHDDDVKVQPKTAPVWDWVSRKIGQQPS